MRLGSIRAEASRRGSVSQSESDVANSPAAEAGPCHPASGLLLGVILLDHHHMDPFKTRPYQIQSAKATH